MLLMLRLFIDYNLTIIENLTNNLYLLFYYVYLFKNKIHIPK